MIDLVQAQAIAIPYGEPVLIGGVVAGAGLFVRWMAMTLVEIRDWARESKHILSDPETGLVKIVYRNFGQTSGALGELSNNVVDLERRTEQRHVDIERRVTRVEDRCKITHSEDE